MMSEIPHRGALPNVGRRTVIAGIATSLVAPAQANEGDVTLTFLHFNDVYRHGPSGDFGGLAQMATMLADERAAAPGPVFQTFGGDVLSPSLTSSVTHGAHMIQLLNALGTDVAVLGNHEFDFGSDVAAQRLRESHFPWLGANVVSSDGTLFGGCTATIMREAAGLRVGFVGVLTRKTARLAPHAEGVSFTDEAQALQLGAAALRASGADIVIAMTHQDLAADVAMARSVPGIDLVLGGHDHEPIELQNATGVPVLKSASDARFLAVAVLKVSRPNPTAGKPAKVRAVNWKMVANVDVAASPAIVPLIAAIDARTDEMLAEPLAKLDTDLDSRASVVRTGEATIGDLVADALRAYFKADIGLVNGGGLRGNRQYPAGYTLTRRDVMGEMPFGNAVEELEISGAVVHEVLEHGVSGFEQRAGRFPQVSGVSFSFNPKAQPGHRISTVMINGQPLGYDQLYRLATTDYLGAGGDGFDVLKYAKTLVDSSGGPLLVNVVSEFVQAAGSVKAAERNRIKQL